MKTLISLRRATASWAFMGLFGIPFLVFFDPFGGWRWPPYNAVYDQMIVAIYVAVGICAARAVQDPLKHVSFLWFIVLSSFTHGGIMLYHALAHKTNLGHLLGDVWILAGGIGLAIPLLKLRRFARNETETAN